MNHVHHLECVNCGARYEPTGELYTCTRPDCDSGILEVHYDYDRIQAAFDEPLDGRIESQWKYRAFLPVPGDASVVTLDEGGTPLLPAPNLSSDLGVELHVKDDARNPTGCLKDRATSISVTNARSLGHSVVTCASTGNAAASLAAYAARAAVDCRIFIPETTPTGKVVQPLVSGADVLAVDGSYDDAYDLSVAVTESLGWYNRNAAINPFQIEAKRTVGFEIAEQTRGDAPDWVVVSMGDGCTVAGAWKGLKEFADLGYVDEIPRILGVQPVGASAIHDAFHGDDATGPADTLVDSVAVERPRNVVKAVRAIRESGGSTVTVSDDAVLEAERTLASTEGVFAEPGGAAPVAGVRKAVARGIIDEDDRVVVIVTGTGLKDTDAATRASGDVTHVEPSLDTVTGLYDTT